MGALLRAASAAQYLNYVASAKPVFFVFGINP
jgi:hypothetical protein